MAKKSKVSGISVAYNIQPGMNGVVEFHRKGDNLWGYKNKRYAVKWHDRIRLRKILGKADFVMSSLSDTSILIQYYYEHNFWDKKWFKRAFNILYWIIMFVWFTYLAQALYIKYILGD